MAGRAKGEVWIADNGEAYFHIKAANGSIVAQSEGYRGRTPGERLAKAEKGLRAVITAALSIDANGSTAIHVER